MRSNEDRELEVKLVELQIKHQHIASLFTVLLSISSSITVSFFIGYVTVGMTLNLPIWTYSGLLMGVAGPLLTIGFYQLYLRRINRLEKEIKELKKEYVW